MSSRFFTFSYFILFSNIFNQLKSTWSRFSERTVTKQYRSTKKSTKPGEWSNKRAPWSRPGGHPPHIQQKIYPPIDPLNPTSFFESNVSRWSTHPQSSSRLALYGVPSQDIPALLDAFTSAVKAKELSSPELEEYYTLSRLAHVQSHDSDREIDIYSTTFFAWVSHPSSSTPRLSNSSHGSLIPPPPPRAFPTSHRQQRNTSFNLHKLPIVRSYTNNIQLHGKCIEK